MLFRSVFVIVTIFETFGTTMSNKEKLIQKLQGKNAKVAVIGLGYVGLPLAVVFAEAGFDVTGIDLDEYKVQTLNAGQSYIQDISSECVSQLVNAGRLSGTSDFSVLNDMDAVSICVPTPLRKTGDPDLSFIVSATESLAPYQSYYLQFDVAGVWERTQAFAGLMIRQFGLPGLALGLVGLIVFGRRSRLYILTGWIALVSTAFAVLYGSQDSYLYLIPLLVSFSIWVGLGIAELTRLLDLRLSMWGVALGLIVIGYFVIRPVTYLTQVDASADRRAELFGREALSAAPENAILFVRGDRAIFALWYFHFALGQRPDLAVVAVDLMHFDWYQETLRATYPSLVLPGPFPWPETLAAANASRPACYARYSDRTEIDCSQLSIPP
jgi:hypothetical protein